MLTVNFTPTYSVSFSVLLKMKLVGSHSLMGTNLTTQIVVESVSEQQRTSASGLILFDQSLKSFQRRTSYSL